MADNDFTTKTKDGYTIISRLKSSSSTHIIMQRADDFAIGYYYNESDGTWGHGAYGFKSESDALIELLKHRCA